MDIKSGFPCCAYFAAANGYDGFRSYFNEIFSPTDFERLYILKGGPGTGKSNFMKRIYEHFLNLGYECDAIFCSSDRHSFDGVIIYGNNGKVGVLDGTAPHEVDARMPGAVDEIINLGVAWDSKGLFDRRYDIEVLVAEKKRRYENAYFFMRLAGDFYKKKKSRDTIADASDIYSNEIAKYTKTLMKNSGRINKKYLLSCFSKDGYISDLAHSFRCQNRVSVYSEKGDEFAYFDALVSVLRENGSDVIRFPSPLSDSLTDAVFIKESDTLIFMDRNKKVSADIVLSASKNDDSFSSFCAEQNALLLEKAKGEFAAASESHFLLEKIYISHMNFDVIDTICKDIILKIEHVISV